MSRLAEYFHLTLMLVGMFFVLASALGMLRFKDLYTRLHAASKGSTFGFCFIIIGASLMIGGERNIAIALVAVLFQFLAAPIGAHMIARVGLKRGIRPIRNASGEPVGDSELEPSKRQ